MNLPAITTTNKYSIIGSPGQHQLVVLGCCQTFHCFTFLVAFRITTQDQIYQNRLSTPRGCLHSPVAVATRTMLPVFFPTRSSVISSRLMHHRGPVAASRFDPSFISSLFRPPPYKRRHRVFVPSDGALPSTSHIGERTNNPAASAPQRRAVAPRYGCVPATQPVTHLPVR